MHADKVQGATRDAGGLGLDVCRLKERGRTFRESFLAKLGLLLRGTVAAPPERFGETLADEHIRGGAYRKHPSQSLPTPLSMLPRCMPHARGRNDKALSKQCRRDCPGLAGNQAVSSAIPKTAAPCLVLVSGSC